MININKFKYKLDFLIWLRNQLTLLSFLNKKKLFVIDKI